jgi:hypothetical protein
MSGALRNNDTPVREMTLPEEIQALKEYNVPERVIERIYKKVMECEEAEQLRLKHRDSMIHDLQDSNRNHKAVINALGAYLVLQEAIVREV